MAARLQRGSVAVAGDRHRVVVRSRSGEDVEHDAALGRSLVGDRVRGEHRLDGGCRGRLVPRVHLRQVVALEHGVTALREAQHAHAVVDRVRLRAPARAELERGNADRERADAGHDAGRRGRNRAAHGRVRQRPRVGIAALRPDPPLVDREGGSVADGRLGAAPSLVDVDPEVGVRKQSRAGVEDELREVGRALTADGVERLADLERVADRATERLVHVGQQARDLLAGPAAELEHLLRPARARRRASS